MPNLDPTQWLLVNLSLLLILLLVISIARRQGRAHDKAKHYRTANGQQIERDSKRVLHQPMATRRVRAGQAPNLHIVPTPHSMPSPLHQVRAQRQPSTGYGENNQASIRGTAAALYDMGHGGKRQASPYTLGSIQHGEWRRAYDAAFVAKTATVQTPAHATETVTTA